jgi:hypothetical protein
MALNLITFASEAEAHSSVPNPWVIGGLVLLLLLGLLAGVVAIGGGRDHS